MGNNISNQCVDGCLKSAPQEAVTIDLAQQKTEDKSIESQFHKTLEAAIAAESEKEEEEDDILPDLPAPANYRTTKRASVSAAVWRPCEFIAPVYEKSTDVKNKLRSTLQDAFMFSSLDPHVMDTVIDAMKFITTKSGEVIITEGDDGDHLYVVESGSFQCTKKQEGGASKLLAVCTEGSTFGELALLYNSPRAASVKCVSTEGGSLWQLDRESFSYLIITAALQKRELYEGFVQKVPMFQCLQVYEHAQMVDALRPHKWKKGDIIIAEGEVGERCFILKSGQLQATKAGRKVQEYTIPGDFFGELALISDAPRAATIVALEDSEGLSIGKKSFQRLFGSLKSLMDERKSQYVE